MGQSISIFGNSAIAPTASTQIVSLYRLLIGPLAQHPAQNQARDAEVDQYAEDIHGSGDKGG